MTIILEGVPYGIIAMLVLVGIGVGMLYDAYTK